MDLAELKQAVTATDPAALLVSPRILRRLLQAQFKVPYLLVRVPHEGCYYFDRQVLFSHVEQEELDLEPDRLLPATVILLSQPSEEKLQSQEGDDPLLKYWALLFHIHVHLALERHRQEGRLTEADVRARVSRIGQTEFEEIRSVLQQENCLLPPADDLNVYVEFAALYLELRYFRPNLRVTYFPAIRDFQKIDQLLAQDVDAEVLFARTRLQGAPQPVVRADTSSDESHDYYWKLLRHAERANREGDIVRAAIVRTRAARVAPANLTPHTHIDALKDLESLTQSLQDIFKFSREESHQWLQVLSALLDRADQGSWPVEAKLLYDLQKVCNEHQRKLFTLDLVEWVLSGGKRPIKRPLTSLQIVRVTRYLRSATQRVTMARLTDDDRKRLTKLLHSALHQSEALLRERFRPILKEAFHDVGLAATSPPEQVALLKMIEELLDRITEYGFFTFSDLRDTLSRNQLKLPDLADPHSFWRGDLLLRLDRRLAPLMEGVYRPGEFYLRWLESSSSLFFGTPLGRFLTRNLVIPFGGAFTLVKGLELCIRDYLHQGLDLPWFTWLLVGFFFLGLTHSDKLRHGLFEAGRLTYRTLRLLLYDIPRALWRLPLLRQVLGSWPLLLLYWYVLKPLALSAVLWLYWPHIFGSLRAGDSGAVFRAALTFFVADVLINSRLGGAVSEALLEACMVLYGWLRFEVMQGLFRGVLRFFKQVTQALEYVLYTVDEWLRFRSDESRSAMVLRAFLGVLWFPVSYLIRLYFIVLIEPSINPFKLPISSLAFKVMCLLPWYPSLMLPGPHQERLAPYTGQVLASMATLMVIIPTVWLLPGAFAFFIWEMKENWKLFRANRAARLQSVAIGKHGETMLQLLKPGFHSGTIPKLFAHLRHAEATAYRTGNWRSARTYRQELHEVARSVQLFVEREFIALLRQSRRWPAQGVHVGQIVVSSNCIRIELDHADWPTEPVWLALEERSGWLVASLQDPGWLIHMTAEQVEVMKAALTGLYKIAGVDLVREQMEAVLTLATPGYEISDSHLTLWTDHQHGHPITYDLTNKQDLLSPYPNGEAGPMPLLDARRLFFSQVSLTWDQWVSYWQNEHQEHKPALLLGEGVPLLPGESRQRPEETAPSAGVQG